MPDMNKKTILVVDDDHEIVRAITITLEREGYHVLNAYDGLQALDCVTSREVHLIIIDVMMPKLDGLSAVMKIREKKNLPIIILSAKGEDSDKILGLSMGADDYISCRHGSDFRGSRFPPAVHLLVCRHRRRCFGLSSCQ